jgi:hypothetical protein
MLGVDITIMYRNFDIKKKIVFGRIEAVLQNKRQNVTHFCTIFLIIKIMRGSVPLSCPYVAMTWLIS